MYATGEARGTNARYLCKGDYDDGGQYCIGFGGGSVDRRLGQELLKVISPLGVEASLKSAGGIERRGCRTACRPVQQTRATGVRGQEGV
jgi:hypothetical protein